MQLIINIEHKAGINFSAIANTSHGSRIIEIRKFPFKSTVKKISNLKN